MSRFRSLPLLLIGFLLILLLAACDPEAAHTVYLEANFEKLNQPAGVDLATAFVVEPGTPARTIAENLQAAGLIDDARLFEAYVRTYGLANQLEAGEFTLSPAMTPVQIAETLQNALAPGILVTVPEGWRWEQAADSLDANTLLSGEEYRILAADAALHAERYPYLADLPAGTSLEGYLYPDSYQLPAENPTAADSDRPATGRIQRARACRPTKPPSPRERPNARCTK